MTERTLTFTEKALAAALDSVQCLSDLGPELIAGSVFRQHPEQAESAHVPDAVFEAEFMTWWEEHGQYCRSGGGDYERTFAFQAWRHLYPRLMHASADVERICEKFRSFERAAVTSFRIQGETMAKLRKELDLARPSRPPELVDNAAGSLPPFAEKVLSKLRRFYDCAEDFESGGVDIGRHWLDLLTRLGLLNRVQRSPALWELSQQGEDLLEAPVAQAEQVPEGWKLVPIEPLLNMMSDKDHDTRITAERQLLAMLAGAGSSA